LKAQAIVKIMEWISPKDDNDKDARCSQFEKSLILMESNLESAQNRLERCRRFAEGWSTLADFISNLDLTRLSPSYTTEKIHIKNTFNNLSPALCSRMKLYVSDKSYISIFKDSIIVGDIATENYSEISNKIEKTLVGQKNHGW
ncbi:hypothetical protein LRP50_25015, partial [Enterovibrio sp. ZSDZ42]